MLFRAPWCPCGEESTIGPAAFSGVQPTDMEQPSESERREHELTMHVFTVSAGMVGVCLTAIGILRLITAQTNVQTLGDDLIAIDALLFVLCASMAFWSFKTRNVVLRRRLRLVVDTLFLVALTAMAAICAIIAYAVF